MDYEFYQAEDFAADESFIAYYLRTDVHHIAFWQKWIGHHPEKLDEIFTAQRLLDMVFLRPEEGVTETEWQRFEEFVRQTEPQVITTLPPKKASKRYLIMAAWSLALVSCLGLITWQWSTSGSKQEQAGLSQIKKHNPYGQRSIFFLEDSTRVTLNANSTLHYPEHFVSDEREVTLVGEAYFEVHKDSLRPFIVRTGSLETKVLGTKFNVNTSAFGKAIEVALEEGSVSVSTDQAQYMVLAPRQKAVFHTESKTLSKTSFRPYEETSWKDGIITFKQASFPEIAHRFKNSYGVQLVSSDKADWSFTGTFKNMDYLSIVRNICFSKRLSYRVEKDTVYIFK